MKKTNSLLILSFLCLAVIGQTFGQKKNEKKPEIIMQSNEANAESPSASQEMLNPDMKAMMLYMTPGPMHEMIAKYDGDWKEEITFWMTPGASPEHFTSSCSNNMIVEGRYQESRHISMMNNMPFEGTGFLGYDNAKKVFVSTWFDNMGTGIMFLEGKWDEKTKTIHFNGTSVDPMNGKDIRVREEFTFIDENKQHLEMFLTKGGVEFKSMEINFSR